MPNPETFAIKWGDIQERFDPHFHRPYFKELVRLVSRRRFKRLGELISQSSEVWDISSGLHPITFPYIEISAVGLGTNEYDIEIVATKHAPSRARQIVRTGDMLVSLTRPHRGAIAVVKSDHDQAIASTGFAVLRDLKIPSIDRNYLFNVLCTNICLDQFLQRSSGGNYPAITPDQLERVILPLPETEKQRTLSSILDSARSTRRGKLAQADELLASLDEFVLNLLEITYPPQPKRIFAIRASNLTNNFNPDRYRGVQLERALHFRNTVGDVCDVVDARTSPSKEDPAAEWDWIRIDDLPNQPWQVETIRTELGANIQGALFQVQENDILLARLGPTIQNAKFVLCPRPKRRTVASSEFLVLRCRAGWSPEAVLWILRIKLYRDIMYYRTRGGTPSRYRLDGTDLSQIPFPRLDSTTQASLVSEVRRRREEASRLKNDAEREWERAKKWFEEQLLKGAE